MDVYHWLRLGAAERTRDEAYTRFRVARPESVDIWGAFSGLFGIASNELVLVARGDSSALVDAASNAGFDLVEASSFEPTVRPPSFEPPTLDGLYVFRFFEVGQADVDEVARLSGEAWTTFEHAEAYSAEPLALFRETDRSAATTRMLLVTWYDGLGSWETSRAPAPEARERFRQRRLLTRRAVAYATRRVDA